MNVLKPNKRTTVATLLATGTSQREIARLTGVDRKTMRHLAQDSAGPESNSPTPATGYDTGPQSLCEPHRSFIEAQLRLRRN